MGIAVTGAFGYSGRYITNRLLATGHEVIILTNSIHRPNPFGGKVTAFPFQFEEPDKLRDSLRGVHTLVNTYWVRFDHRLFTHRQAVANTEILFAAAKAAGVRRIVHVSITNPESTSELPYFRGKAALESSLKGLGVSYCILRPTVLFGKEDVLINNIAWALRHLPVCGIFGFGDYRLQPIYVDDLAQAAARKVGGDGDEVLQAIGPETFTYGELVARPPRAGREAAAHFRTARAGVLGVPGGRAVCRRCRDHREEIQGLMEERLFVEAPPLGITKLTEWVDQHKDTLGRHYTSELARRLDRTSAYRSN